MYDIDDSEYTNIIDKITKDKLERYFEITGKALKMCEIAMDKKRHKEAKDFFDMASRYYSDAGHFMKHNDYVLAFGALNYAHGWLDAGARIGLFDVHDSTLFTVDDKE
ncbi:MAG: DUF357 domain-containing protein [Ignavibacteriaceae bacterium]|jgi:hypothetical protein|nr:DUF357 domain-containing protein [Ignavibacteriaceae bacterium]